MKTFNQLLSVENLHKYLGKDENRTHVLRGVSFSLDPGRLYSIVGPSGCGKSTLLYLLGLLDHEDKGTITICDQLLSVRDDDERTAARNQYLGFVFQFHFLLPEFTAEENVMLPMYKHSKRSAREMQDHARYLLNLVGLGNKTKRNANHLSGGEQQRVAIARALANDPVIILADEPTGNLDTQNSNRVFDLMLQLCHEKNYAILMVTHNPNLAERSDKILRMADGQFIGS